MTQDSNRKNTKQQKIASASFSPPQTDLEILIDKQRDSSTFVYTVRFLWKTS